MTDKRDNRQRRLVRAIADSFDNHSLMIRYAAMNGRTTTREITPLCFQVSNTAKNGGKLLVLAYCWKQRALRAFFIHRIRGVDPIRLRVVSNEMLCDLLLSGQFNRYERDFVPTPYVLGIWAKEEQSEEEDL